MEVQNQKKYLRIFSISTVVILVGFSAYLVSSYLKEEKLWFYAKGIDEKALINATWKMSDKEVERANGCKLSKVKSFVELDPELNKLLDISRIQCKRSCDMNIWGNNREVIYDFFDDQLFRIRIYDDIYDRNLIDSLVVSNLEPKYGKIMRDKNMSYSGIFNTEDTNVKYEQFEYQDQEENKIVKRFKLEITYKPLFKEIKRIAKIDQEKIF